jgi:hypothetical protein
LQQNRTVHTHGHHVNAKRAPCEKCLPALTPELAEHTADYNALDARLYESFFSSDTGRCSLRTVRGRGLEAVAVSVAEPR